MVKISEENKCIYVFGEALQDTISFYKSKGYTIVRFANGTDNIKDCIRTVITSSNIV